MRNYDNWLVLLILKIVIKGLDYMNGWIVDNSNIREFLNILGESNYIIIIEG